MQMTAEEIGEAGENIFEGLCNRARMICNKSRRDRTGWDHFVELPMPTTSGAQSLDRRKPTSCLVQVKTVTGGRGPRAALRLSAAERLAKNATPAFIVVIRIRSDGTGIDGYLIHLLGDPLARILKRLRLEHARGRFDVNHATLSFDYQKLGRHFALTPEGLNGALNEACGTDPSAYVAEKARQLDELGSDGGVEAEALIRIESFDQFSKIFLGLAPMRPERLKAFDTRFGIRLPYQGSLFDGVEDFFIQLPHVDSCTVAMRGDAFSPAAIFTGDIQAAPPIEGLPWAVIRHAEFAMTLGHESLHFETVGNFDEKHRSLDDWCLLVRGLRYLASGSATVTITMDKLRTSPVSVNAAGPLTGPYQDQLPALESFLTGWRDLIGAAGISSTTPFAIDSIWNSSEAGLAIDLLTKPTPTAYLEFADLGEYLLDEPIAALYFDSCSFADVSISYCVKATLTPSGARPWRYRSTGFERVDVRPAVQDLTAYGEEHAERLGIRVLIDPRNLSRVNPAEA